MLFYFVRHGQTEANQKEILAGSGIDHPLNESGHGQAADLAQSVVARIGRPLHHLLVSEMTRTRQTAGYLARSLNLEPEIVADFREWHLGEWEGQRFADFGHLILGSGEPKTGERREAFYRRVHEAWKKHHVPEKPYIIVSHGGVWLALQDNLKIPRFKIENCQLVKVWFEGERWRAQIL